MFNLLVSGSGDAWEEPNGSMMVSRFKEYSGAEADAISLANPASLRNLEDLPALLMYELGARGPNPRLVRHGRLRNISRVGQDLTFRFEPDPQHGYLSRGIIEEFADQLDLHHFEQHRTHWALKDGHLPDGLLAKATALPPVRDLATVADEYRDALANGPSQRIQSLREEFEAFPPSTEKAGFYLHFRPQAELPLEALLLVGIERRTSNARKVIRRALMAYNSQSDSPFSFVWFLEQFSGPAEQDNLDRAVSVCLSRLAQLKTDRSDTDSTLALTALAESLWRCARTNILARKVRHIDGDILDYLAAHQAEDGSWSTANGAADFRTTAFATVALQRLGDDKFRTQSRLATLSLCKAQSAEGGIPRLVNGPGEPLTTTVALEAVRRSGLALTLTEEIERGETWLFKAQEPSGAWESPDTDTSEVTALVLDYFARRSAILAQVDGFFLMARDFFRKAEELALGGGANDRRLAAIAAVHAVEMFMYGLFERRPDLGLSAYRDNGVETIGPREALRMLQDSLYEAGLLIRPRRLALRDQVTSLISRRDSIIHRAHEISAEELELGLKHVRAFIDQYGAQLATLDLLQ